MSDATWKIRQRKNGPQRVSGKDTAAQDQFELVVTVKSEHRPRIVRQWQGEINVDQFGNQHMRYISLVKTSRANEANDADATDAMDEEPIVQQLNLYKIMNTTDDTETLFTKIANYCDRFTQDMESKLVERKEKERRNEQKVRTTLLRLAELEDEGTHDAAPSREET